MAHPDEDRPRTRLHPPTLLLIALIVGYVVRLFVGGFLPIPRPIGEGVGLLLVILAIILLQMGTSAFSAGGEELRPSTPSRQLFTKGIFGFSRNPIYLAMILLGSGLGFATLNLWMIMSTAVFAMIITAFVIIPEERYLTDRFGDEFDQYRRKVRRWI